MASVGFECLKPSNFSYFTIVEDDGPAEDMDPYDLMDPVEILTKLPKDFYEKIVCNTKRLLNVC